MNEQLSDQTFDSRLQNILGVLCYVDYKEKSNVDVILLHEHLGLQNYMRVMGQSLTYNQFSIIFPNLFEESGGDKNSVEEEDNANYLKGLNHERIALIALSIIDFVAQRGNAIVLVGFSLGSAIGLKILQYTNKVDLAFMFYGFPPLKSVKPEKITARTTIFSGLADKVAYLSDKSILKKAKQAYTKNESIRFVDLQGGRHGFMNPACDHYDEALFEKCCQEFHKQIQQGIAQRQLSKVKIEGGELSNGDNGENNGGQKSGGKNRNLENESSTSIKVGKKGEQEQKKEEDSGCSLY